MKLKINDILYTKDGRRSGNLCVIDVKTNLNTALMYSEAYTCLSDYGNRVIISSSSELEGFFKSIGKAKDGHKYYNYKMRFPEEFI